MYKFIKDYYLMGLYNDLDLNLFVSVAWITEDQKKELVANKSTQ